MGTAQGLGLRETSYVRSKCNWFLYSIYVDE
jgi:hypothetical protein